MMPAYQLARWDGDGSHIPTFAGAFRPSGIVDDTSQWWDFRPDYTKAAGFAILINPTPAPTIRSTLLTADPTLISQALHDQLQTVFNTPLILDTVPGMIDQLKVALLPSLRLSGPPLITPPVIAGGAPTSKEEYRYIRSLPPYERRKYLLWRFGMRGGAPPFTDSFTYTENPISNSGKWGGTAAVSQCKSNGTQAGGSGAGDNMSLASGVGGWTADQYSQITLVTVLTGSSKLQGNLVRFQTATENGYATVTDGGAGFGGIYKFVSGSASIVKAYTGAWANGDVSYLEDVGTTLTWKQNSVTKATQSDATYGAADNPGICCSDILGAGGTVLDDFTGDNIGAAPSEVELMTGRRMISVP